MVFVQSGFKKYIYEFLIPLATSRAPLISVLGILRRFGIIEPKIDQIWAWLHRGHRWAVGVRDPLKSLVKALNLSVNCYLENKFHKKCRDSYSCQMSNVMCGLV